MQLYSLRVTDTKRNISQLVLDSEGHVITGTAKDLRKHVKPSMQAFKTRAGRGFSPNKIEQIPAPKLLTKKN